MTRRTATLLGIFALSACAVAGLWRWKTAELLRLEIAERATRQTARVRAKSSSVDTPLVGEGDETRALRAEIDQLHGRIDALHRSEASTAARSEPGPWLGPADLRDAGRMSPRAALETALWAANGGDINKLDTLLWLENGARNIGERLFAGLSRENQMKYGSADRLLVIMAANEMAFSSLRMTSENQVGETEVDVNIVYRTTAAEPKDARLTLRRIADGGWKLVLPESAAMKYAAQLKGMSLAGTR